MPTLAARLAVSVAAASVIMTGIEALRARHPRIPGQSASQAEAVAPPTSAPPRLGPSQVMAAEPAPAREPTPRGSFAMARIHGRVVGSAAALEELKIRIEDSARGYQAQVDAGGTFEINLPAGSYTIVATSEKEVAVADVAGLLENEDREVVLVLAEGVSIEGRVEGCAGVCEGATIRAEVSGVHILAATSESDEKGEFAVEGLVPGRTYDLTFDGQHVRRLVLRSVQAPRRGLVATLEPAGTLSGGFGLAPGQKCPMESVVLETPGEDTGPRTVRFDRACRFRSENLPEGDHVHVRATGKGWHFELDVSLPAHGDPPFLCLHPTCREPEPEPKATLEVSGSGDPRRAFSVSATFSDDQEDATAYCPSMSGSCVIDNLRPSQGVKVEVHGTGCENRTFTLDIHPGPNHLTYACEVLRRIQGVVKTTAERTETPSGSVRCSSDHPARPVNGFVFALQCPERLSVIEYQLAPGGPWRTAAISPGHAENVGFVEIAAE